MSKPDGGQVFGSNCCGATDHICNAEPGMTLRDWFAGQALMLISQRHVSKYDCESIANLAYEQADAMLKEREKS